MKKVIFLILLAIVVGAIIYATRDPVPELGFEKPDASQTFKPDPSNATFAGVEGEITVLEQRAYGDLNSDEKIDAVVFLVENTGGTGVFVYVAAYVSGLVNYKGTNAIFLGDRISPQDISISNGIVTAEYLDRGPDESFSTEPTIRVSREFVFKNGTLEEK